MTDYLTTADVLAIHEDLINRFGGTHGVRDHGLLEAALYRPQTGYYAGLIEEAAALWESLSQNHAFVDGNKRVAFDAMHIFLTINGARLEANVREATTFVTGLYDTNEFKFERLVSWLRKRVALGDIAEAR